MISKRKRVCPFGMATGQVTRCHQTEPCSPSIHHGNLSTNRSQKPGQRSNSLSTENTLIFVSPNSSPYSQNLPKKKSFICNPPSCPSFEGKHASTSPKHSCQAKKMTFRRFLHPICNQSQMILYFLILFIIFSFGKL